MRLFSYLYTPLAHRLVKWISADTILQWTVYATRIKSNNLPPKDALRFLFELDAQLYPMQGQAAIAYDDGIHAKHRLMRYHDFFVGRITSNNRILDIGCGIGALAHSIATRTEAKVTGIEINETNVSAARKLHSAPNIEYIHGDARKVKVDGNFDVIVLSNVLEHIEKRPEFLKMILEKYAPERFLIRVPQFERDWRVPLKQELGIESRLDKTHFIEYTHETFDDEMLIAGLCIIYKEVRWGEIWSELVPA